MAGRSVRAVARLASAIAVSYAPDRGRAARATLPDGHAGALVRRPGTGDLPCPARPPAGGRGRCSSSVARRPSAGSTTRSRPHCPSSSPHATVLHVTGDDGYAVGLRRREALDPALRDRIPAGAVPARRDGRRARRRHHHRRPGRLLDAGRGDDPRAAAHRGALPPRGRAPARQRRRPGAGRCGHRHRGRRLRRPGAARRARPCSTSRSAWRPWPPRAVRRASPGPPRPTPRCSWPWPSASRCRRTRRWTTIVAARP